ncbi:A/G-specific adenine glycosylase [Capnocytophaga sp. ARDL2]|uniref:A/G-specific adenine glycosylase n=1 Tax=Capnocytophaga sp. ARDL2 TaxID=3238809 RepID=UPI0035589022
MYFANQLIEWYQQNGRILPWRETKNPYHIWLSEIILQQTRVAQGMDYYLRFVDKYPTLTDLASADLQEVLKLWQGLGYYSRARNLHHTAIDIKENYNEKFPATFNEIQKLKGIGPYTAAAIASFAFDEKVAVVDGNVFRVLARFFGIFDDISLAKTRKIFQELGNDLIQNVNPALFNQAIMDFGATVCKPQNPLCNECVFTEKCFAYRKNKIEHLPVKNKKISIKNRHFHYLINEDFNEISISERKENDIWKGLYEFPKIEEADFRSKEEILSLFQEKFQIPAENIVLFKENVKHKLSHQLLMISFWKTTKLMNLPFKKINKNKLNEYPFPIILWKEVIEKM